MSQILLLLFEFCNLEMSLKLIATLSSKHAKRQKTIHTRYMGLSEYKSLEYSAH